MQKARGKGKEGYAFGLRPVKNSGYVPVHRHNVRRQANHRRCYPTMDLKPRGTFSRTWQSCCRATSPRPRCRYTPRIVGTACRPVSHYQPKNCLYRRVSAAVRNRWTECNAITGAENAMHNSLPCYIISTRPLIRRNKSALSGSYRSADRVPQRIDRLFLLNVIGQKIADGDSLAALRGEKFARIIPNSLQTAGKL